MEFSRLCCNYAFTELLDRCINSRSLLGESVHSNSHPDVSIHETEHGLSFMVEQFIVCQSFSGFDTSSSCVSLADKEDKRIRGKEHKRKQRGQLAAGVKGHLTYCDGYNSLQEV